ncbi:hypothetical protein D5086_016830 [Populus alba]|uniref:Uncharacterized protein n=1 Tax=Populus alba TaxID=43335 RepID=A0ACC4BXV3_POPAL
MGNEMGNNNTSGLREEDSTTDEAQEKSVQAPTNANVVKEENHVVPAGESKDYHEKVTGLDCDDRKGSGDTHDHNQTSDEAEHAEVHPTPETFSFVEHAEAHPTPESPKAETKPNEVGGGDIEFPPASFPNELEGDEKSTESDLEETVLGANSNQLERQASFKKEEQEIMSVSTFVTISPSHDPEPQESMDLKFDQQEFIENHSEQSVKDSTNSLETSENILGSNVVEDIITKENGHLVETCASDNLDGILVSGTTLNMEKKMGDLSEKEVASQEDKMLSEEKVDVEVGNEVGNDLSKTIVMESTTIRSDSRSEHREKCEEEFTREMDCYGNNCSESQPEVNLIAYSPNCHMEQSVPEDKCMVLTEETEFTRKESETEVNKHHYSPNQLMDDSNRESDIDLEHASQTDSFPGPSFKNNEESSDDASHDPASNGSCQVEEAKVSENSNHIDLFNDIQSEVSEDGCKESEGNTMIVPELGIVPEELSMSNWKSNEGATDCKLEEEKTAEKTDAPCAIGKGGEQQQSGDQLVSKTLAVQAEAYNPQAPASLFQSQDQQLEKVTVSVDAQGSNELTLELKPESCEEFLVAKVSTDQGEVMNILGTSASAVELAMDKPQEEASSYFIAAREMRKSPSFDLDLRIEARSEESDQTPLLYQDKTTVESLSDQSDVSLQSPHLLSQCSQETLRALPLEESVITLERSDSEKSRTPFLGFLKEDEEAHAVVTPKKQDNHAAAKKTTKDLWNSPTKEVASASPKEIGRFGKEIANQTALLLPLIVSFVYYIYNTIVVKLYV